MPFNALRMVFYPQGMRLFVENWEDVAGHLIERAHREAAGTPPDSVSQVFLRELLAYPGVPDCWRFPYLDRVPAFLLTVVYRKGDLRLSFFSTIMTFGTSQDVTLQ